MKELRPEVVADLALRSVLVCQQEAEAAGFPEEAAQDIWEGIMDDDANGWSSREFLEWTKEIDKKYGCSQWPKLSEAIPTADQYALAVAHDPSVEAVILVAPNGVGHAAAKSCPVEATVWAWDELLFKPAGDWAEVAGYWVAEGQLVSVDENVH